MLVLNSVNPLSVEKTPSPKTFEYYKNFYEHTNVAENHKVTKKALDLEHFDLNQHIGKSFKDIPWNPKALSYFNSCPGISLFTGSKLTIADASVLFHVFGVYIDFRVLNEPDLHQFLFLTSDEAREKGLNLAHQQKLPAIVLPYKFSKSQLIKAIRENWKQIKNATANLPEFGDEYLPDNPELVQDLLMLRARKLTYPKISDQLIVKYPQDLRVYDPNQLKSMHRRYKAWFIRSMKSISQMLVVEGNTKLTKSV